MGIVYCACADCLEQITDPNRAMFMDRDALVCEGCLRESIGLRDASNPGSNYTFGEIVDALGIEHHTAKYWHDYFKCGLGV